MPEQYQYVKLPDGTYGKFSHAASDNEIRAKITAAFPNAYKQAATPAPQKRRSRGNNGSNRQSRNGNRGPGYRNHQR